MFYSRDIEDTLKRYSKFPVIAILGPRQSGKTTLAKHVFKDYAYINLDDLELRRMITEDTKGFLRKYDNQYGIIIDEFQNYPDLLSYIKVIVDQTDRPGYFVLTGSQNFLMNEAITQSLAGRVGILTLLPFSLNELNENNLLNKEKPEQTVFNGCYPKLYTGDFKPDEIYPSYIRTYIERDVRQLINITNLSAFQKFIKLCAARVGQLVNFSELAISTGISEPTVRQWLSILEASYIIFLLRPHWTNFSKRIVKTPKLYFYDTGLACSLLEIETEKQLTMNSAYGSLFECLIISDLYKQFYNQGKNAPLYFWRDKNGEIEVDCIISKADNLIPIKIKSGETYTPSFFKALDKWNKLSAQDPQKSYVVYAGNQMLSGTHGNLISWQNSGQLARLISDKID